MLTQGRLGPLIHAVVAKYWPFHLRVSAEIQIHQSRLCFSSLQLSNYHEFMPTVLGLKKWLLLSSVVVAYQRQGQTWCSFWDVFLLTTVVKSGYLSYYSLCVSCTRCFHPKIMLTNKPAAHWMIFVFGNILSKTVWKNPRISAISEILKPSCLAPAIMPMLKSLISHLSPILMFDVNINWNSWLVSAGFYALCTAPMSND